MILHTGWLHPLHVQVRLGFGATDMSKQELKKIIDSARIFWGWKLTWCRSESCALLFEDRRMYYRSEDLNDKLFIHYKASKHFQISNLVQFHAVAQGWKEMKNLEGWTANSVHDATGVGLVSDFRTGLKALYAECNAFDRISGLSQCRNLRSLFLQDILVQFLRLPGIMSVTSAN